MLTDEKKLLLKNLYDISEFVDEIWKKQFDQESSSLTVYPEDFKESDFGNNPELLSPYTVIKKSGKKYVAVPYGVEYKDELDKIYKALGECEKTAKGIDKKLSTYLGRIKSYLIKEDYEAIDKEYVLYDGWTSINLGPFETYEDTHFGIKKSYQFALTHKYTGAAATYTKDLQKLAENAAVILPAGVDAKRKIKIEFVNVATLGGRFSAYPVSTICLPNSKLIADKYGSKIQIFMNSIANRVTSLLLLGKKYLVNTSNIEMEKLMRGFLLMAVMHQVFDITVRFDDAQKRLGKYYDMVREISSFMLTIQTGLNYVAKGWISSDELASMIDSIMLFGVDSIRKQDKSNTYAQYAKGFEIYFDFMIKKGLIKKVGDKYDYQCNGDLCGLNSFLPVIMDIYSKGTVKDMQKLTNIS